MVRLTTREKVAIGLGLIGLVLLLIALEIGLWGCMAYFLINKLLPLFDISYPLTWVQCFGVGVLITIVAIIRK